MGNIATLLAEIEYENNRSYAVLLLDGDEADPPQDIIRIIADGEPLIDLTFGELSDLSVLLGISTGKCLKAFVENMPIPFP